MRAKACISLVAFFVSALGVRQKARVKSSGQGDQFKNKMVAKYMAAVLCKTPIDVDNRKSIDELCTMHAIQECCNVEYPETVAVKGASGAARARYLEVVGGEDGIENTDAEVDPGTEIDQQGVNVPDTVAEDESGEVSDDASESHKSELIAAWYTPEGTAELAPWAVCMQTCLMYWVKDGTPKDGQCRAIKDTAECSEAMKKVQNMPDDIKPEVLSLKMESPIFKVFKGVLTPGCQIIKMRKKLRMAFVGTDAKHTEFCGYFKE